MLGLMLCAMTALYARDFKVIYKFHGGTDGDGPLAGLVADANGNLYGTTEGGGDTDCDSGWGCGTVFKVDANGNERILYRFTGAPDGEEPMAGLTIDSDGNLYGTTYTGGSSGEGAVFKVDTTGHETILYSFGAYPDGANPSGGLVLDRNGNIYGTTQEGGTGTSCFGGCGTVFKLDSDGKETVLLNVAPPAQYPTAALTLDNIGTLYGTTFGGNSCCLGTVFRMGMGSPSAATLHIFSGGAGGASPAGGLVRDAKGRLYGVTVVGGDSGCLYNYGSGCGVVYQLSATGKETVLHRFTGRWDGAAPNAGLLRDRAGNLYGTTLIGGDSHYGTVFKLDKHGKVTVLHSFNNKDGSDPSSTLIQDASGNIYGTTQSGGDLSCNNGYGCGVVFKITP
jgi:uncharacterized repeat protein (TIGR03803 family)